MELRIKFSNICINGFILKEKMGIYRIVKMREKKTKNFAQIRYIKDESNKVLMNDAEIKERWKSYFHQHF